MIDPSALDELVDTYENRVGPRNGALVVAKAWSDPAYKKRLLEDGTAAIAELGFSGVQGEDMVVVENTPDPQYDRLHAVLLFPWPTLGCRRPGTSRHPIAPASSSIRAGSCRIRDRRPADKEIRVWDSSAELRYLVCQSVRPEPGLG